MAPNNFEKNSREKLSNRTIEPSQDAWKVLEGQLTEKKPKYWNFKYLYGAVAAVFIGILIILNVAETGKVEIDNTNSQVITDTESDSNEEIEQKEILSIKKEQPIVTGSEQKIIQNKTLETFKSNEKEEVALSEIRKKVNDTITKLEENNKMSLLVVNNKSKEDSIVDHKVYEVVELIAQLQQHKDSVTDAEVEALLAQAEKEIKAQRIFINATQVDAQALLLDVEEELDKSFRDRVFEVIKSGYQKVKTSVAERNN